MDDLIKRQDAIDIVTFECGEWQGIANRINEQIQRLPSAEPVQKTGEWMREILGSTSGYGTTVMYQCTNCEKMSISKYKFCPNCGSRMENES